MKKVTIMGNGAERFEKGVSTGDAAEAPEFKTFRRINDELESAVLAAADCVNFDDELGCSAEIGSPEISISVRGKHEATISVDYRVTFTITTDCAGAAAFLDEIPEDEDAEDWGTLEKVEEETFADKINRIRELTQRHRNRSS